MTRVAQPGQEQRMVTDAMIEAGYAIMLQPESEAGCDYKTQLGRAYAAMHAARPTADLGEDEELAAALLRAKTNIQMGGDILRIDSGDLQLFVRVLLRGRG